jgi:hypothetical protein
VHARPKRTLSVPFDEAIRQDVIALQNTEVFQHSRRLRKKVEILFAHMKQHFRFTRLKLRGLAVAAEEFLLVAIAELETRKIHFESLTEKIETRSPAGKLVFHVFAALAEFEPNLIRERTMAGLKAERARGRTGGRPAKLSPKEIKTIRALLKTADIPVAEIAQPFGIARSTLYRNVLRPVA